MSDQEPLQKRNSRTGANIWWDREQLANRRVESKSRRDVQSEAGGSHAGEHLPIDDGSWNGYQVSFLGSRSGDCTYGRKREIP